MIHRDWLCFSQINQVRTSNASLQISVREFYYVDLNIVLRVLPSLFLLSCKYWRLITQIRVLVLVHLKIRVELLVALNVHDRRLSVILLSPLLLQIQILVFEDRLFHGSSFLPFSHNQVFSFLDHNCPWLVRSFHHLV